MTDFELVQLCISANGLPERLRWAAGMSVKLPEPLARCLTLMSYEEPETKALAERSLHYLRTRAAYTPDPPFSARLPFSYRRIPGLARRRIARVIGYVKWTQRASWGSFPRWPVDLSADVAADLAGHRPVSFPRTPVLLTHDIDSAEGLENLIAKFLPIEEAAGARSANYLVPHAWPLDYGAIDEIARRGHEIGVHGYDHANRTPFVAAHERAQRLARGREFGNRYGAVGYRAPSSCARKRCWRIWRPFTVTI